MLEIDNFLNGFSRAEKQVLTIQDIIIVVMVLDDASRIKNLDIEREKQIMPEGNTDARK